MKLKNTNLRIALDLDDTILDWWGAYKKRFPNSDFTNQSTITRNVRKLKYDRDFWENLELLETPNFEPHIYATKRIIQKSYTRNSLIKNGLPIKPIYQMYYQNGNKADLIKGRCDVLIDDSYSNVAKAIKSGLPALLIDRPHNQNVECEFRIYHLDYNEILDAYLNELDILGYAT
jgi:FMN phosphatase YigB (HAD superfamily)